MPVSLSRVAIDPRTLDAHAVAEYAAKAHEQSVTAFLTNIIPQKYTFEMNGQQIGHAAQNWNFFAPKMNVDFTSDPGRQFDRRMATAAVVLLMAIEHRQKQYD